MMNYDNDLYIYHALYAWLHGAYGIYGTHMVSYRNSDILALW